MLGMASLYKCRPSTLFGITDPYTAYCLDEACTLITVKIEGGEEPQFVRKYTSFKDIYSKYQ